MQCTHYKHTRCTLWAHYMHTTHKLQAYYMHTTNALSTHYAHTKPTLWAHYEHTKQTPRAYHAHTMRTLCSHYVHTTSTLCTHYTNTKRTLWIHYGHTTRTPHAHLAHTPRAHHVHTMSTLQAHYAARMHTTCTQCTHYEHTTRTRYTHTTSTLCSYVPNNYEPNIRPCRTWPKLPYNWTTLVRMFSCRWWGFSLGLFQSLCSLNAQKHPHTLLVAAPHKVMLFSNVAIVSTFRLLVRHFLHQEWFFETLPKMLKNPCPPVSPLCTALHLWCPFSLIAHVTAKLWLKYSESPRNDPESVEEDWPQQNFRFSL